MKRASLKKRTVYPVCYPEAAKALRDLSFTPWITPRILRDVRAVGEIPRRLRWLGMTGIRRSVENGGASPL